jgi:hypothetical protein
MKLSEFSGLLAVKTTSQFLQSVAYYTVVAACIFLFWFILNVDFDPLQTNGLDANVFCMAGRSIRNHENPYIADNLNTNVSWNYLPIYAYGFRVLCSQLGFMERYAYLYVILLLVGVDKWLGHKSWLYGLVLCLTGLYSFGWNLTTGNIGVVEFFVLSASFFLLWKEKNAPAFLLLGILSSVKILTLLYFVPFLYLVKEQQQRYLSLFFGALGFISPFLISSITSFELMPWYVRQLFGMIPGQHSPLLENMGFKSPSMVNLLVDLLSLNLPSMLRLALGIVLFGFAFVLISKLFGNDVSNGIPWQAVAGVHLWTTVLFFPYIKPYSYLPALLAVYLVTRHMARWVWTVMLLLISLFPMVFYYSYKYDVMDLSFISHFWVNGPFLNFVSAYNQPVFLVLAFSFIVFLLKKQKLHAVTGAENSE